LRKELWFGFTLMAIIVGAVIVFTPWGSLNDGHLGLIMLAMIVVTIMLGFPTAFTLMGMGVFFAWLAYRNVNPDLAVQQVLDLMVLRAYGVMSNDVLIAVPLFVFMGYLVERSALIDRLFKSLHLAMSGVPGSLAVATIVTCAVFATATGIVGAVVTLMGLLALPAMLKARYNVSVAAGAITAGGCLGIMIPPSILLIVYGATAGVSVVQLYAGAFFPGLMLAGLYVAYVIILAKLKPNLMPPLPESERRVELPAFAQQLAGRGRNAVVGLSRALGGGTGAAVAKRTAAAQLLIALLPALVVAALLVTTYRSATAPEEEVDTTGLIEAGISFSTYEEEPVGLIGQAPIEESATGLQEPPVEESETGLQEPPVEAETGLQEPPSDEAAELAALPDAEAPPPETREPEVEATPAGTDVAERLPAPTGFWITLGICVAALAYIYLRWNWERLEVFKMLLASFFPLTILILAVLGSIVFGFATPTEAAAVGAFGGFILAAVYRFIEHWRMARSNGRNPATAVITTVKELGVITKESSFLTAKTSAMVCWLFVGSAIFSAAFALLGGQELVENWVLSLDLTPVQFLILAQCIIFILGWPLEWTEIIIIFMPIFIPLLTHFQIDPLFFGLLVALNLQTAFLSPPVAMAAFYLKGVAPPHVTLNQIFGGMLPFMGIQIIAIVLLYVFPEIGLWLPHVLYDR
jgi:TRAP-type mannitol/chloroaromatic compound transport system permease large subunit